MEENKEFDEKDIKKAQKLLKMYWPQKVGQINLTY